MKWIILIDDIRHRNYFHCCCALPFDVQNKAHSVYGASSSLSNNEIILDPHAQFQLKFRCVFFRVYFVRKYFPIVSIYLLTKNILILKWSECACFSSVLCVLRYCFQIERMCSPFSIDIRPRRLPAEIKQIEESSNDHGEWNNMGEHPNQLDFQIELTAIAFMRI